MVKRFIKPSRAFTVIELVVVMGIMAFVGVLSLYGIRTTNNKQNVTDAQRSFLTDLRSLQNKVNNGAGGANFKVVQIISSTRYSVDGVNIDLPNSVTLNNVGYKLFFSNPLYTGHLANQCGSNAFGATFFACTNSNTVVSSGNLNFVFASGSYSNTVRINGTNMIITNMYAY